MGNFGIVVFVIRVCNNPISSWAHKKNVYVKQQTLTKVWVRFSKQFSPVCDWVYDAITIGKNML